MNLMGALNAARGAPEAGVGLYNPGNAGILNPEALHRY